MTPPEMLRRAAYLLDEAKRTHDRALFLEAAELVARVHASAQETIDPPIEALGVRRVAK